MITIWPPSQHTLGGSESPHRALYLFGDEQAVGVLYGRALVQQQRLKLPLLNVIERVEHNSKKLRKEEMRHKFWSVFCTATWAKASETGRNIQSREARRGTAVGGIFLLKQDRGSDGSPSIRTKKRSGRTLHTLIHFFVWKRPRYFWSPNTH